MKRSWVEALHKRFGVLFGQKFLVCFTEPETLDEWCSVWGEALRDISAEQMKYGLNLVTKECEWAPTVSEFRDRAKSMPNPILPYLPPPRRARTQAQGIAMEKIREMFANPKKPGLWWKAEVLARAERGEPVGMAALELAGK